ncbi:unnamed protein product [Cylicocyclus nassatus]|uniref:Uncharacterized protein n=1 Tax=Cylicocyclus nassatus TaxID=53992 RepID=A0AA36HBB1_CYLNA|nr:unnamed protein product [Cylicocyclus nassatus]
MAVVITWLIDCTSEVLSDPNINAKELAKLDRGLKRRRPPSISQMDYLFSSTFVVIAFVFLCSTIKWSRTFSSSEFRTRYIVNSYQYDILPEAEKSYDDWHSCMTSILLPVSNIDKLWSSFSKTVETCRQRTAMRKLHLTEIKGGQENKYHIFNDTDNTPSVVITLGVGWDALAEQKLRKRLPNDSIFFGADPIYEINDQLYSTVGTFFPIAVGNETKVTKAYVMPKELGGNFGIGV